MFISHRSWSMLKGVLDDIIGENQSAFVPERMIFDNVMVAYETIHSMKRKHCGKNANMALKLDISKAYNIFEWPYLEWVMKTFGFSNRWISLIMNCVSSITYSLMVNAN